MHTSAIVFFPVPGRRGASLYDVVLDCVELACKLGYFIFKRLGYRKLEQTFNLGYLGIVDVFTKRITVNAFLHG